MMTEDKQGESVSSSLDQTDSLTRRLNVINVVDRGILSGQNFTDIINYALKEFADLIHCDMASMEFIDAESGELFPVCKIFKGQISNEAMMGYSLDNPFQLSSLIQGKAFAIDDLDELESLTEPEKLLSRAGVRSYVNLPLMVSQNLVGILQFCYFDQRSIRGDILAGVKEIADHIAVVVHHENLVDQINVLQENLERRIEERTEELEKRASQFGLLNEMGELLHSCVHLDEAYSVVQDQVPRIFPDLSGGLGILDKDLEELDFKAVWRDYKIPAETNFSPDDCWALRRGRPHFVQQVKPGNLCRHIEVVQGVGIDETFCIPLVAQGQSMGILYLQKSMGDGDDNSLSGEAYNEDRGLSPARQRLAQAVAEQIGLAISNVRLQDTLRIQAVRDPLTNLFNRRYMEEVLSRKIVRVARSGGQLAVIMLDLDHFKLFNDRHGHTAGDMVLKKLGEFLSLQVRKDDIACRYGGEEFVLILPDIKEVVANERAERIRQGFKQLEFEVSPGVYDSVTISLGIAIFPVHGSGDTELISAADAAMYQAKTKGRDRVEIAKSPQRKK
jgi:diguanylate cyclase (GGDEF)-like protein